jgi:tRNA(Ile)-lysidine synthetase-like protein
MTSISELVDFWFNNPDIWFGCGPEIDQKITNTYGRLLYMELKPDNDINHNLGLILLWDQVSRHVYRNDKIRIIPFHHKALILSLDMLNRKEDMMLNSDKRCFLLMPLRHTFDIKSIEAVIEKTREYIKLDGFEPYRRFYKASLLSYSKLVTQSITLETIANNISNDDIGNILDVRSCKTIFPVFNDVKSSPLYKAFEKLILREKPKGITLSISGGVDSMVCSYLLYHIRQRYNIPIIAVMVNYNNRIECDIETQLVTRWLRLLDIDVYIRHVKYLRRKNEDDPTDRNFYEDVTKEFRFDLYRRFEYPVVLGHNKDDSIENIFTNIRKGRNYDNLKGMDYVSSVNNITIYRPLLDIAKIDIYTFAHENKVPFLLDSTPKWSDRGRMRDELIPFLNKFDPSLIPGLLNLTNNLSELTSMETVTVNNFIKTIEFGNKNATIKCGIEERGLGFSFWKQVLRHITSNMNTNMCSNKSIHTLIKYFTKYNLSNSGRVNLSKHLEMVDRNGYLIFTNLE